MILTVLHVLLDCEGDCGAFVLLRFQRYLTAHLVDELLGDRQSETGAPHVELGPPLVHHSEHLEQPSTVRLRNSDSGVGHLELQLSVGRGDDVDSDASDVSELERVADQVEQHLLDATGVSDHRLIPERVGTPEPQVEALAIALHFEDELDFLEHLVHREGRLRQSEDAHLHFGEVEDVFGEVQQNFGGDLTNFDELGGGLHQTHDVFVVFVATLDFGTVGF